MEIDRIENLALSDTETKPGKITLEMIRIHNPHDKLFHLVFIVIEFAIAFLKFALPKSVLPLLDLKKLKVSKRDFVDSHLFKDFTADVIYEVPLRAYPEKVVRLCIVLEHKSYDDTMAISQLAHYVDQLMQHEEKKARESGTLDKDFRYPVVFSIILHHGKSQFTGNTQLQNQFPPIPELAAYQPALKAHLVDLNSYTMDELPDDPNCPELKIVLMVMKAVFEHGRQGEIDCEACFRKIAPYIKKYPDKALFAREIILYFRSASELDQSWFHKVAEPMIPAEWREHEMPTINEQIFELGCHEGEARGEARGELRGRMKTILSIIKRKFGAIPVEVQEQIESMSDRIALETLAVEASMCLTLDEFCEKL